MGKPKLKSSIRALQVAISSLRPVGPVCVQLAKTDSFRTATAAAAANLFVGDSIYCSSSSSSPSCNDSVTSSSFIIECADPDPVPRGPIASGRFFFSPSTSRNIMDELTQKLFSGNSVQIAFCSDDPYSDFRSSMEEMVAATGVKDWRSLQELLHCYLKINERRNHKIIVIAFVDLLMSIITAGDGKDELSLPL